MSDMIKDRYKKEFEQIKPSEEFLNRLTSTLEQEQSCRKRRRINCSPNTIVTVAVASIAAILCGLAFFLHSLNIGSSSGNDVLPSQNDIDHKYNNYDSDALSTKPVNTLSLFEEDMTAEQCAGIFMDKVRNGELSYIKVSESNVFASAGMVDDEQKNVLLDLMDTGKNTDSIPDGEKVYYMAVFSDGTIVKFIVTDSKYIEFSGMDKYICVK